MTKTKKFAREGEKACSISGAKDKTAPAKQAELFGRFTSMSLLDMWKECGRIRRVIYGKQMAEERKQALVQLQAEKQAEGLK